MILSVCNDGSDWSLDFGPKSVTLTMKDLVQEMTIKSQGIPLAAWSVSFLLSQKQDFLKNHLARVPVTRIQQGTIKIGGEVLLSVGAQDMDTSGYQVSADLDYVEFYGKNVHLDVDAVFRLGIDAPFSPSTFSYFQMSSMVRKTDSDWRSARQWELCSS